MKAIIVVLIFITFVSSCSIEKKIKRQYTGKPEKFLIENFDKPVRVVETNGKKVYLYEKKKDLKSTEISQGKLALDPMVTPRTKKTERYWFTVSDSTITNVIYEEVYERK